MCRSVEHLRPGRRRVYRPYVRLKRIYAFAAMRWADAKTPIAMKVWKGVMDAATGLEAHEEIEPWFLAMVEEARKAGYPPEHFL
jgi:hypothetical protein